MMELLLFDRWVYNFVVRTLVSNSKLSTLDINKTQNKVFVAKIYPGYEFNYSDSLIDLNVLFLYFRTSTEMSIDTHVIYKMGIGKLV